jgi:uncharacterized protein with FMN-binding domain
VISICDHRLISKESHLEKNESPAYWALLALTLAFSVLAVVTLVPNPAAVKPNVIGYRSLCSFAPAATALCGFCAGVTCTLRNRLVSRRASSMRYRPLFIPAGVGLILLVVALVFGIRFGAAQSRFGAIIAQTSLATVTPGVLKDGIRSATFREGEVEATVEVTVESGRVESLRLVSGKNVDATLAQALFSRVREAGSTTVDAVSGATASSKVLLKAVESAARGQ